MNNLTLHLKKIIAVTFLLINRISIVWMNLRLHFFFINLKPVLCCVTID